MISPETLGLVGLAFNAQMLVINVGFTNAEAVSVPNPGMFSPFGQLMIIVWGFVYAAAGRISSQDKSGASASIWLVCAVEKFCYAAGWVQWHRTHDGLAPLAEGWNSQDGFGVVPLLAPFFHCFYGPMDFSFGVAFAYMAMQQMQKQKNKAS